MATGLDLLSPGDVALVGFHERLLADQQLAALLLAAVPAKAKLMEGPPTDARQEGDFPRIAFSLVADVETAPGYHQVRVQVDYQAWPLGAAGGPLRLGALDKRVRALVRERVWVFSGVRITGGIASAARPGPHGGKDAPLRRLRDFYLFARAEQPEE